jgi:hypothetical protein
MPMRWRVSTNGDTAGRRQLPVADNPAHAKYVLTINTYSDIR